ncbi:MAG TPA: group III truncated hemoglobin [Pedobacter sp.]|nr:group III truncated hemoglobin [Pedobacter sp.]
MTATIQTRADIQRLVELFYNKALSDPIIGHIFKATHFDLEIHIPVMVSFWETILLDVHTYQGNPMAKHIDINKTIALEAAHFEHWLFLWASTITDNFTGEKAEEAISRASGIAKIMQAKISQSQT